ncbi:MAG: tRNA pseudouridine(54/55) synthase Pus10 [Candidatus Micrarchaeota archaeon]
MNDELRGQIQKMLEEAARELRGLEFSSFVVGSILPAKIEAEEELLWERNGIARSARSTKQKINRLIGSRLEKKLKKRVSREEPDVLLLFDFNKNRVSVSANPLFVYGRYTKLSRGMPQNKMPNYYESSIEEIVGKVLCAQARGESFKLHGCGREDIDARMLGEGRPFIIEITNPQRRNIDLAPAAREIHLASRGEVEVFGLRSARAWEVAMLKNARPDKTYRMKVIADKKITKKDLSRIEALSGAVIRQRTPTRVAHRRADRVRKRKIKEIRARPLGAREFELEITTSAGTYVKEFVSGDDGRTKPSVSEVLGCRARCAELDVVGVRHGFLSDFW